MKPFDLEAAKRGEPICRRNGDLERLIAHLPDANEEYRVVTLNARGRVRSYTEDGKVFTHSEEAALFMAEKPKVKREGWVNVYRVKGELVDTMVGYVWDAENKAMTNARGDSIATVRIEWEEEA